MPLLDHTIGFHPLELLSPYTYLCLPPPDLACLQAEQEEKERRKKEIGSNAQRSGALVEVAPWRLNSSDFQLVRTLGDGSQGQVRLG